MLLVLIATAVIGYLMAKSVSRPIIETNRAAKAPAPGRVRAAASQRGIPGEGTTFWFEMKKAEEKKA